MSESVVPQDAGVASSSKEQQLKRSASPEQQSADATGSSSGNGKRARIDHRGDNNRTEAASTTADGAEKEDRLPKRKVAVLFGYCGIGYSGLQVNPGVKTIEGDMFDAMCQAGCISADNAVNPNKVSLQRAARTDGGVHAAGNLINLKLILNPPESPSGDEKELVKYLNSKLPPLIRIWAIHRVQNAFDARKNCESRKYQYLLPTYAFLPPKPGSAMWNMYKKWEEELAKSEEESARVGEAAQKRLQQCLYHPFWSAALKEHQAASASSDLPAEPRSPKEYMEEENAPEMTTFKRDSKRKRAWRLSEDPQGSELLARIRSTFNQFIGTHNFHNFTVGKAFRDPSAKRTMRELEISDPFIVNDTEYISVTLHGQSFILHQIRKMIGLLTLVVRSPAPEEKIMKESFGPLKIHVPKAPALGLLLNAPQYPGYNQKVRQQNNAAGRQLAAGKMSQAEHDASIRDEINFDEVRQEMEEFRMKHIYQFQYKTEEEEDAFAKWLNYLDAIVGDDFSFLNPKGIVPREAINAGPDRAARPEREKQDAERNAKREKDAAARRQGAAASGEAVTTGAAGAAASAPAPSSTSHPSEQYEESDDEDIAGQKAIDLEG